MTERECVSGHMSECQTPTVLRKALHQERQRQQLHDDRIIELQYQKSSLVAAIPGTKFAGFIQSIGLDPFHALFFLLISS
jgi:hypothetical protein